MKCTSIVLFCILLCFSTSVHADTSISESTVKDQTAVEVTVYNSNFGFVKDTRQVAVPTGIGELRFMDVAATVIPETVHVKSVNQSGEFFVLEQNYEYDLMNARKLLDKYVGKKIKLIDVNKYQDRRDSIEATLLSNNQDQIFRINNEIYLGHPGIKVLPEIPDNLIAQPTLTWLYRNRGPQSQNIEVSYLANDITWKADYIAIMDEHDTASDISAWVTVDNRSGATYNNASLKLIAGDVHRAARPPVRKLYAERIQAEEAVPQFEEKAFFEYHIYDLQRATTIKDRQTKQIRLFQAENIRILKEYLVGGTKSYFTRSYGTKKMTAPVNVYVRFRNDKAHNLGMPLPAGTIRVYKKDAGNSQQFIGEDTIQHTPRNEEIKLGLGKAFDIVAERTQTDFKRLTSKRFESAWEITVKNHKDEKITVGIIEPLYGNWKMIENSHPYTKVDAFTARFDVDIPKDSEKTIRYRIQTGL
jgi:hypothetical protein